MVATIRQYKAACVQAEPGWFDLEKSVQKTINLITEAGEKGCKLIAFPELCKFIDVYNNHECFADTFLRDSRVQDTENDRHDDDLQLTGMIDTLTGDGGSTTKTLCLCSKNITRTVCVPTLKR